jgi:hypothetical protein
MVERGLQSGSGRIDDRWAGNLREQRWSFRRLQGRNVAPEKIWFSGSVQQDAAQPFVKRGAAAEQACHRRVHGLAGAIEIVFQAPSQQTDAGTIRGFREHLLRIEPRDESLRAHIVRDKAGCDADGAIGAVGSA